MTNPIALARASLIAIAVGELLWSLAYYVRPDLALGSLGRSVVDPVMARQYPLYLASVALAYALAATNPVRYRGMIAIGIAQRAIELGAAILDVRSHTLGVSAFGRVVTIEAAIGIGLVLLLRTTPFRTDRLRESRERSDRGLRRMLLGFGALELFWFFASTVFVRFGSFLLAWKLQDLYTTQQQGIALAIVGLVSILAASDLARYRIFVWVPVASQLIGIANSCVEIHRGSIGWGVAATQWTIEGSIVAAFAYLSRDRARAWLARTPGVAIAEIT